MNSPKHLNAEIRELLAQAAEDPKSLIGRALSEPLTLPLRVGERSILRSRARAERHLAETYREQTAVWLFDLAKDRFIRSVWGKTRLRTIDGRLSPAPTHHNESCPSVSALASFSPVGSTELDESAARDLPEVTLAGLALTLWPRDEFRIFYAQALHRAGQSSTAARLLEQVTKRPTSSMAEAMAFDSLGGVASGTGLEFYARAARSAFFIPHSTLNWFVGALTEGDDEQVRNVAARIGEWGSEMDPIVTDFLGVVRASRSTLSLYRPNLPRSQRIRRLDSGLPELARRIAHEL